MSIFILFLCLSLIHNGDSIDTTMATKNQHRENLCLGSDAIKNIEKCRARKSRAGFVDDVASDVIHIIDPPKHFQRMKMIVNQMEHGGQLQMNKFKSRNNKLIPTTAVTTIRTPTSTFFSKSTRQSQRNYNHRYKNEKNESDAKLMKVRFTTTTPTTTTDATSTTTTTTTSEKPTIGKLTQIKAKARRNKRPQQQQQQQQQKNAYQRQRHHAVSIQPQQQLKLRNVNMNNGKQTPQNQRQANDLDLLTQETQSLPMTHIPLQFPLEILASMRKTERLIHKQRPNVPLAPAQQLKTRRTHTVILEEGYDHEHEKQLLQHQLQAEKVKFYAKTYDKNNNYNMKNNEYLHKNSRIRRQVSKIDLNDNNSNSNKSNKIKINNSTDTALNVVHYISELLKNATQYLPKNFASTNKTNKRFYNNTSKIAGELTAQFYEDTLPKALIGEIDPLHNINVIRAPLSNSLAADNAKLYTVLENSVNVTDALLNELLQRQKSSNLRCKRTLPINSLSSPLSQRMIQLQDKVWCMQQQTHYKQRLTPRISYTTRLGKQLYLFDGKGQQKSANFPIRNQENDAQTHALLYDDVMSNIRNMLLVATSTRTPREISQDVNDYRINYNDFNDLNQYLNHVGEIVDQIPFTKNGDENNSKAIDDRNRESDENWFRINDEGKIEQQMDKALNSLPAIFYRFPDIPGAEQLQ